jgi:predicted DNA-binding antitoxin AbrB/MazE fold protein
MKQVIEAIYEKGIFKPLKRPKITEGQKVQLIVDTKPAPLDLIELAGQVYEGLSEKDINEIEQIALNRKDFFREMSFEKSRAAVME